MPGIPALLHIHQRLEPVVLSCDPLHVAGPVWAASAQGRHMINVPARAGAARAARGRAGVFSTEGPDLGAVAQDFGLGRNGGCRSADGGGQAKDCGGGGQMRAFISGKLQACLANLRCQQELSPRVAPPLVSERAQGARTRQRS